MNTSQQRSKVIETRFIWAPTIQEAMNKAADMAFSGWTVEGNPAPMTLSGEYGTGISVVRVTNEY